MSKQVTAKSVLRTLERLRVLTQYYSVESVAAAISPNFRIDQIAEMMVYLEQVAKAVGKRMQWKCAECGRDIWFRDDVLAKTRQIQRVRRDAHYCSQACRQKAFRQRKHVTDRVANTTVQLSRVAAVQPQAPCNCNT
jgi:hypothetical protein